MIQSCRHLTFAGCIAVCLGSSLWSAPGEDFPSKNVTLLEHFPLDAFPSEPTGGNDCWGYVSPAGREYALMGVRNAAVVVDITDLTASVIVASIPHESSNWCDIKTYDAYAYAVNETGGGLDVIDLSQVDSGVVTLVQRVTDAGLSTCHNLAIDEVSGFLYLCGSNINGGRLVAMDLTNPADPVIAGNFPASGGDVHDAQVVTYAQGPYAGRQIAFCSSGPHGLEVYDVTNKAAMFVVATSGYPNLAFSHQNWLSDDRQYLYLNDELDSVNETVVFDVSDIDNPTFVTSYSSNVAATDHNLYYHEGFIYEAEYRAGMRVFDATDPVAPVQVGWIDTFPEDDIEGSAGAWSVYPFLPSGKILISDKNRGLFVVWRGRPPLSFAFVAGAPPSRIDPDGDAFQVRITANSGQRLDPASAELVYDFGNGPVVASMVSLGGDLFEARFGATPCGSVVQFHVRAQTTGKILVRSPLRASCETLLAIAADDSTIVLEDDLELDTGWVVGAPGDTAASGVWERVDPNGTDAQPEDDHTPGTGITCFVTGQGSPGGSTTADDVDDGATTLTSPSIDLSGVQRATISYWRWYDNSFMQPDGDEGAVPSEDVFEVWVSDDDGMSWAPVETIGPRGPEASGGWFLHYFDVGSLVDLTDEVRLRFVASDVGNPSIVEAAVDDVVVFGVTCHSDLLQTDF